MSAEPPTPNLRDMTAVDRVEVRASTFANDVLPPMVLMKLDGRTMLGPVQRFYALTFEDTAKLIALLIDAGCRINPADFKGLLVRWADTWAEGSL